VPGESSGFRSLFRRALPVLAAVLAVGCGGHAADLRIREANRDIRVFGAELGSARDFREIGGVAATEEPCLGGYERCFDALAVSVAYGNDRKIRRITTRNRETSAFGISPGRPFEEGVSALGSAGFHPGGTPYRFGDGVLSVTLLVDEAGTIFGITVERERGTD
jgi:hypothetical protein